MEQNNDLTPVSSSLHQAGPLFDQLNSSTPIASNNQQDYYESFTPSYINGMLSPLAQKNMGSDAFSQSYNQHQLKQHLQESLSIQKRKSSNLVNYNNGIQNNEFSNNYQLKNDGEHQNGLQYKDDYADNNDEIAIYYEQREYKQQPPEKFLLELTLAFTEWIWINLAIQLPKKEPLLLSNISIVKQQWQLHFQQQYQQYYSQFSFSGNINTNNDSPSKQQQLENDFLDISDPQIKNTQNVQHSPVQNQLGNSLKQSQGATLNYQTASFGSNLRFNKNQTKISQVTQEEQTPQTQKSQNDPMYGTFTDISGAQDSNKLILNSELRAKLQDTNSNWKVRTEAIDEVLVILQQQIIENQARLSSQAEPLIDFIIQLLNDQNFKIVLTSLMIIKEQENVLNSQQLGRFVPHFVKKLGDSKNIIRQEAVRAIITVYEIMRRGKTSQNMLVALILPYVNNSSNWHIREELLNVFILCFLKSRNFYEFDSIQIIESFVLLLNDQKDKVRLMAKEALATYASIGNKFSFKEIIFQICDPTQKQEILDRLDQENIPFINDDGALELPYLEIIDNQIREQTTIQNSAAVGQTQFALPTLSRRESMSSNSQMPPKSVNSSYIRQPSRGNSSGRRIVPPSANSMANYVSQANKRTVSANNIKMENEQASYYDQSPAVLANKFLVQDKQIYQNNTHFGFLPSLNKAQSQQISNNSYYSQNASLINNHMHDHQIYSASGVRQNTHQLIQQSNSFKINQSEQKQQTFGNMHKGVHSANAYSSQIQSNQLYQKEDVYQQNKGFLNQLQQNQNLFDQNQQLQEFQMNQLQQQQTINYNGQNSNGMTQYESQKSHNTSQQNSRIGTREGVTPIKKQQNQNTFYSDGSFTTTTTSIPDKIKQLRANKQRFNIANINEQSNKRNIQIINNPNANHSLQNAYNDSLEINNTSQSDIKNQSSILGGNQRGPIKATRHAIQQQQSQVQQDVESQQKANIPQQQDLQDLCIDNRKNKRKSVNKNQDLQEILEETKNADNQISKAGIQMRRTNFGQPDFEDSQPKYIETEDLEPLNNPEKDFKKALNTMLRSDNWSVVFEGCCIIRKICKHHSSIIVQQSGLIGGLITQIIKIADSLRSSLSKIGLITISDMFMSLKRCIEPQLDALCKVLLKRSSDTNTFISEAADKAMLSMCQNCQDTKVLQIILQSNLIKVLGNSILFFKDNDKLLSQVANYLSDACPEVRLIAKQSFIDLSQSIMGYNDREKLLQRVLNEVQLKKVKDLLDKEPAYLSNNGQLQNDFVIINANQHYLHNKKQSQTKNQNSKGQLRSASLNKSNLGSQGDQPLNIQATKIIKPSQIKKRVSQEDVKNVTPQKKDAVLDQFFIDTLKDLILQTQIQDWKTKLDSVNNLYDFMNQNAKIFQTKSSNKFVELSDILSSLMSDQNAKIQQSSLDKFLQIIPKIQLFVESYIVTFYQALTSNLASSNTSVKKLTENILVQINEQITDKTVIIQTLLTQIQFSSNSRLKPLLIDQLSDMIPQINEQKQSYIIKTVLPVSFKLLDDNRSDVKQKTEKLLKSIYQILGQQMLESCPQQKLQRLCDIVLSGAQISNTGIATFGAQTINGLLKGANIQ
eukprot:403342823